MAEEFDLPYPQYRCPSCGTDLPLDEARITVTCAAHLPEDEVAFTVREAKPGDKRAIERICDRALGEIEVDTLGKTYDVLGGTNLVAEVRDELAGLLSLSVQQGRGVIVLLSVYPEYQGKGLGAALVDTATVWARDRGLPAIRVGISNDDIPLLCFYQRHGFAIDEIAVGALADATGAAVPGFSGIPSRDEIRLHKPIQVV